MPAQSPATPAGGAAKPSVQPLTVTGKAPDYRRQFNDRLAGEIIARDPFNTLRFSSVVETSTLTQHTVENLHLRSISIGFTYALGAARKPAPRDFDFDSGGAAH